MIALLLLYSALLTFLYDSVDFQDEEKNYGNLILSQKIVSVKEMYEIIKLIAEKNVLSIKGLQDFKLEGNYSSVRSIPSKTRSGYVMSNWPSVYAEYNLQNPPVLPKLPIISKNLELYPDGNKAVMKFLDLRAAHSPSHIIITIPDYRLTIKELKISGNKVTLEILPLNLDSKNLIAKFYIDYESTPYIGEREFYSIPSDDYNFIENQTSLQIDVEYSYILAAVVEKTTGKILDYREHYLSGYPREGVTIDPDEVDIQEMLRRGENVRVEFKQKIGDEFLETVVAFANTLGDYIFLGVADDTSIIGFESQSKDQITNLITSNIDPKPDFTEWDTDIDGKPITILLIANGENKPYSHRQLGVYVRSGATDRRATRSDLDSIYKDKDKNSISYL
jgi:hypothetical protein